MVTARPKDGMAGELVRERSDDSGGPDPTSGKPSRSCASLKSAELNSGRDQSVWNVP